MGKGVDDAIIRATSYINAGADAIMIHSKDENADSIIAFCEQYQAKWG